MEKIAKSELRKAKGKSEVAPEQIPTIAINAATTRNPGRACRAGVCSCGDGAPAIGAVGGEYGLESNLFTVGRTTEGFYDTASLRRQKASQHQSVYQKQTALPKRRCPRRGKPKRVTEGSNVANQMMFQGRSRGLA